MTRKEKLLLAFLVIALGVGLGLLMFLVRTAEGASVRLRWTAPHDSVGCTEYDLRWSSVKPDTTTHETMLVWWDHETTSVPDSLLPFPSPPGSRDSSGLIEVSPDLTYYFNIRTGDAAGNWSDFSNVWVRAREDATGPEKIHDLEVIEVTATPNPLSERQWLAGEFASDIVGADFSD